MWCARHLHASRRRRCAACVLWIVCTATPRPRSSRHCCQRRTTRSRSQRRRSGLHRVHPRGTCAARRLPRHWPHPLQHHRKLKPAQHSAVLGRDDARHTRSRPQRQPRQCRRPSRRTAGPRLRTHRHQRHRGLHTHACRCRRSHVGRAHRAHDARLEGRLLDGHLGQRSSSRRS